MKTNAQQVTLGQIFVSFAKVGAVLFGGGYAMLPLLEREAVARRGWFKAEEMSDYYAMAQLMPGVVAVNTAMLFGHSLRGFWGTLAATLGVVAAPFFVILAYAVAFEQMRDSAWLVQAMAGVRPAAAGLLLGMAWTMFARGRKIRLGIVISLAVVFLTLVCGLSAVTVILLGVAAGVGWFAIDAVRRR